jgi:hypothetical protein
MINIDNSDLIDHSVYPLMHPLTLTLAYCSTCCNPITYCFLSQKFRDATLIALGCKANVATGSGSGDGDRRTRVIEHDNCSDECAVARTCSHECVSVGCVVFSRRCMRTRTIIELHPAGDSV